MPSPLLIVAACTKMSSKKKQIPLRISQKLYEEIAAWAGKDFRSINGQIEYLLTECVRQRKKNGKYLPKHLAERDSDSK